MTKHAVDDLVPQDEIILEGYFQNPATVPADIHMTVCTEPGPSSLLSGGGVTEVFFSTRDQRWQGFVRVQKPLIKVGPSPADPTGAMRPAGVYAHWMLVPKMFGNMLRIGGVDGPARTS